MTVQHPAVGEEAEPFRQVAPPNISADIIATASAYDRDESNEANRGMDRTPVAQDSPKLQVSTASLARTTLAHQPSIPRCSLKRTAEATDSPDHHRACTVGPFASRPPTTLQNTSLLKPQTHRPVARTLSPDVSYRSASQSGAYANASCRSIIGNYIPDLPINASSADPRGYLRLPQTHHLLNGGGPSIYTAHSCSSASSSAAASSLFAQPPYRPVSASSFPVTPVSAALPYEADADRFLCDSTLSQLSSAVLDASTLPSPLLSQAYAASATPGGEQHHLSLPPQAQGQPPSPASSPDTRAKGAEEDDAFPLTPLTETGVQGESSDMSTTNKTSNKTTMPFRPNNRFGNELTKQARSSTKIILPRQNSGTCTFVHKLYDILSDERYREYMFWTSNGDTFKIPNVNAFCKHVLPQCFKHGNFQSFIRQLNMYGFQKVNKGARRIKGKDGVIEYLPCEFGNELFRQGKPELVRLIRRRVPDANGVSAPPLTLHASRGPPQPQPPSQEAEADADSGNVAVAASASTPVDMDIAYDEQHHNVAKEDLTQKHEAGQRPISDTPTILASVQPPKTPLDPTLTKKDTSSAHLVPSSIPGPSSNAGPRCHPSNTIGQPTHNNSPVVHASADSSVRALQEEIHFLRQAQKESAEVILQMSQWIQTQSQQDWMTQPMMSSPPTSSAPATSSRDATMQAAYAGRHIPPTYSYQPHFAAAEQSHATPVKLEEEEEVERRGSSGLQSTLHHATLHLPYTPPSQDYRASAEDVLVPTQYAMQDFYKASLERDLLYNIDHGMTSAWRNMT